MLTAKTRELHRPIVRERVLERMRLASEYRVVVVTAAAGYGKTIAIGQHIEASGLRTFSFTVRKDHATVPAFVRGFSDAIRSLVPTLAERVPGPREAAADGTMLISQVAQWFSTMLCKAQGTIVLEDMHLASGDDRVGALLVEIVNRTPETLRWIISSRHRSELPIATWYSRGVSDLPINESDLRFTPSEASSVARVVAPEVTLDRLEELLAYTGGWPTAFSMALGISSRVADPKIAASAARQMIYEYLAEQIFNELPKADRSFLLETCLLPCLRIRLLSELGFDEASSTLDRLLCRTPSLTATVSNDVCYQGLFREFLECQLELSGSAAYRSVLLKTAIALESAGLKCEAFKLFVKGEDLPNVRRLLLKCGLELIERGALDAVRAQLFSRDFEDETQSPALLALKAEVYSRLGQFSESNALFEAALKAAEPQLGMEFLQRYAVSLINQYRHEEAFEALSALDIQAITNRHLRCRLAATIAAACSAGGQYERAEHFITIALDLVARINDDMLHASILNSAAFVSIRSREHGKARTYALRSVRAAESAGCYDLAARACSTLVNVANDEGDTQGTYDNCQRMFEFAQIAGERSVSRVALMGLYYLAVERGDEEKVGELELKIEALDGASEPRWRETLLPAKAMRLAWQGRHLEAFELLSNSGYNQANEEQRFLRNSEIALYAAAAGERKRAETELLRAGKIEGYLTNRELVTQRVVKGVIFLALAYSLIERPLHGVQFLQALESRRLLNTPGLYALWRTGMLFAAWAPGVNSDELERSLAGLERYDFGGLALLVRRLMAEKSGVNHKLAALTPTELVVLQTLTKGHSSKVMASQLRCSPRTVDTHVRAILRKLECRGRVEAARIAREHGLV